MQSNLNQFPYGPLFMAIHFGNVLHVFLIRAIHVLKVEVIFSAYLAY